MLQGRGHTHGGSAEARNEQLGRNTPDLHPAEGDSNIRNQEGEGHSSGVQQPSEVAPERTSGGGSQGGRDTTGMLMIRSSLGDLGVSLSAPAILQSVLTTTS